MIKTDRAIITVIPAEPGFYVLDLIGEANEAEPREFWRAPVIAWRIETQHESGSQITDTAYPITAEEIHETAILYPNGTVSNGLEQFVNEAAAMESFQTRHRAAIRNRDAQNPG